MAKPEIRLKGFEGEWETTFLNDIAKGFSYGINAAAMPFDGVNKYLRITDIDDSTRIFEKNNLTSPNAKDIESYILQDGDITFARTGASVGKSYIYNPEDGKVIFAGFLIRAQMKETVCPHFVYYNTLTNGYYKYIKIVSQRSGQPGVNSKEYGEYSLCLPKDKKEQQSIADYFKSLDSMIQGVMKKIVSLKQMKQACLVSLFPQAGETTPRVRFKGFKGEWEIVKLSSIATRVTRKNSHLESTLPLTISAAEGLIEQTSFFNNVVASSNVSGYYLVKRGEFAYNKSYSNGYPFGAVKRLDRYDMGVLSTLYIVFAVSETFCSDYIVHFFDTSLWHQEVAKRAAEGARNHGLLNIGAEDFLDIDIIVPKNEQEQKQIASFFHSFDSQISLQEQRLEKLKQIKSACLDKMFV